MIFSTNINTSRPHLVYKYILYLWVIRTKIYYGNVNKRLYELEVGTFIYLFIYLLLQNTNKVHTKIINLKIYQSSDLNWDCFVVLDKRFSFFLFFLYNIARYCNKTANAVVRPTCVICRDFCAVIVLLVSRLPTFLYYSDRRGAMCKVFLLCWLKMFALSHTSTLHTVIHNIILQFM